MTDNGRKIYASEISTQYIFLGELNSRYPEIQIWAKNNNFCGKINIQFLIIYYVILTFLFSWKHFFEGFLCSKYSILTFAYEARK